MDLPRVEIYTDGACSPNPGVGGWGAILIFPEENRRETQCGAERYTTNNRMELLAAIKALQSLQRPHIVKLVTDSTYLCQAFRAGWLIAWKKNGWKTANRSPVQNVDLWRELDQLAQTHQIQWEWVKGHAAHPENELADRLAVGARQVLAIETHD